MMVVVLAHCDASAVAPWRATAGIEGCVVEAQLWLRLPEAMSQDCLNWPALHRYRLQGENELLPWGPGLRAATLPIRLLPAGPWVPLVELWPLAVPAIGLGGQTAVTSLPRPAITLVPSTVEQPLTHLQLSLDDFLAWAEMAPLVRLARLSFAASSRGDVLVTGLPLPSLPGKAWWSPGPGLLVPAGYTLASWIAAEWLVPGDALARVQSWRLFLPDGGCEIIPNEAILPVTRAALRATRAGHSSPEADFLRSLAH